MPESDCADAEKGDGVGVKSKSEDGTNEEGLTFMKRDYQQSRMVSTIMAQMGRRGWRTSFHLGGVKAHMKQPIEAVGPRVGNTATHKGGWHMQHQSVQGPRA